MIIWSHTLIVVTLDQGDYKSYNDAMLSFSLNREKENINHKISL